MLKMNQTSWISIFVWGVMMCLVIACADVPQSENPFEGDWSTEQSALIDSECFVDGMGGPTSCKPEALWVQYAEDACADQNMVLTKYRVAKKCGKGLFRYIKFQCCPKEPLGDVCCKTNQGFQTIPAGKCPDTQVVADQYCEDEPCVPAKLGNAEQCQSEMNWIIAAQKHCKQQYGMVMTQHSVGGQCADGLYHAIKFLCCPADIQEEICCKISFGPNTGNAIYTTPDDCKKQGGIPTSSDYCEQTVCCNTSAGAQFMTMTSCPFLNVLADSDCELDPEPSSCETFKAIDMGNLPASLTNGASLLSYSGWGIWPTTLISSNSCSTIPAGSQRAAVGVNNDATLTFDQPISEFYLLTLYVQPGDDLTIAQPATITQMGCVPGGQAGNGYYHIVLDTPSAVVTIQDINPGGGSGYSFMVADCDDEVVVEDVCCETSSGYQILPSDQCPWPQQVSMSYCEDPEPPTCENFEAINMAGLPSGNLSTGGILTGYTGWGTWASGLPSSNSCSTIPAGAERGFVGVNQNATLTFDTPVSEFYLLQLHVQPGDELTITQPATITQMGCAPGGFGGGAYHHIALATPTTTVTIEDINPGGGSGYSIMVANCVDNVVVEDVCCKLDNGFQIVPANQCPTGQQVPMSYCEEPVEDVCCKLDNGFQIVPANQCPTGQQVPMSYCEDPVEDLCCKLPGGYQIVTPSDCPAGQQVPMSYCKEPVEDVCCKLDSGVQIVPANQCPPGHQVSMNLCEDEDVCCELAGGPQTVPASQCPPGHILPDAQCDELETTCCRLDTGFAWVPAGQCPTQLWAPDYYCEEVCCETSDGYQMLQTYQCPSSSVVNDSYCAQEPPCDDAVYGQCKGFDYSNDQYCDASGLDCGPQGILGDLDCDGEYEVCLECPAGTEPKDTNGDGCEDVCDCIDDTTTPTGPVELEPAKK